jgi:large-conductance mechanosensitive channel
MDQETKAPDRVETRKWIGRILMAVILGEAIWALIVSVMSNLVVPWLGTMMGQTSGLPLSFTRNYDYPDLFVSVVTFCIAGIIAVSINHFTGGTRRTVQVKVRKTGSAAPQKAAPIPNVESKIPLTIPAPPTPAAVRAESPKPQKPKEVLYNLVGEPLTPEDDNS